MKIFDTHSHYNDLRFESDLDSLLKDLKNNGVDELVNISAENNDGESLYNLTKKYINDASVPKIYYTVGLHPDEIPLIDVGTNEALNILDNFKSYFDKDIKPVAIGEIGLDYHGDRTLEAKKYQKEWFIAQIELAKYLNMPIVVHSRDACKDTFDILKEYCKGMSVVLHCFSYEKEIAIEYVKMGFFIGVGGVITFKNDRKLKESVASIPIESILTETDAPYLSPMPHRGERNNSTNIKYVIKTISEIKNIDEEKLSEVLYNNAHKFYNIK